MFEKSKVLFYKDFYENKSLEIYEIRDFQYVLFSVNWCVNLK